jgi:hypothetical protein
MPSSEILRYVVLVVLRTVLRLLVKVNLSSSTILVTQMVEAIESSKSSALI